VTDKMYLLYVFTLSSIHVWLRCSNFFNPSKKILIVLKIGEKKEKPKTYQHPCVFRRLPVRISTSTSPNLTENFVVFLSPSRKNVDLYVHRAMNISFSINLWVQVMKLLITQFSPISSHFFPCSCKYSTQHRVLKHTQSMFLPEVNPKSFYLGLVVYNVKTVSWDYYRFPYQFSFHEKPVYISLNRPYKGQCTREQRFTPPLEHKKDTLPWGYTECFMRKGKYSGRSQYRSF
jgi:hypothetical protein